MKSNSRIGSPIAKNETKNSALSEIRRQPVDTVTMNSSPNDEPINLNNLQSLNLRQNLFQRLMSFNRTKVESAAFDQQQ